MLLLTRESRRWRYATIVLVLLFSGLYLWHGSREFPHGGSTWGLAFGIGAFVLILLLLFFGVRKRMYRSRRWGRLETWLQSHVYLGFLALVLAVYHSGFRLDDKVAVATLVVLVLVVVTGFIGAVLYTTVPRVLTEVQSNVPMEEMSEDLQQLERSMAHLADDKSRVFRGIHRKLLEPSRPKLWAGWRILFGRPPNLQAPDGDWAEHLGLVPSEEREDLKELLVLWRQHREIHQRLVLQQRYKNLLDAWLYFHVPLSLALVVLMTFHAYWALHYRGVFWGD